MFGSLGVKKRNSVVKILRGRGERGWLRIGELSAAIGRLKSRKGKKSFAIPLTKTGGGGGCAGSRGRKRVQGRG